MLVPQEAGVDLVGGWHITATGSGPGSHMVVEWQHCAAARIVSKLQHADYGINLRHVPSLLVQVAQPGLYKVTLMYQSDHEATFRLWAGPYNLIRQQRALSIEAIVPASVRKAAVGTCAHPCCNAAATKQRHTQCSPQYWLVVAGIISHCFTFRNPTCMWPAGMTCWQWMLHMMYVVALLHISHSCVVLFAADDDDNDDNGDDCTSA